MAVRLTQNVKLLEWLTAAEAQLGKGKEGTQLKTALRAAAAAKLALI